MKQLNVEEEEFDISFLYTSTPLKNDHIECILKNTLLTNNNIAVDA
jgi:hypothetical protein